MGGRGNPMMPGGGLGPFPPQGMGQPGFGSQGMDPFGQGGMFTQPEGFNDLNPDIPFPEDPLRIGNVRRPGQMNPHGNHGGGMFQPGGGLGGGFGPGGGPGGNMYM